MTKAQIDQHLSAAARARAAGNQAAYRASLEAAVTIDPTHPVARNALGVAALVTGDGVSAAEHFLAATSRDPQSPPLWVNLATAARTMGDDEAEREALDRLFELDQTHLVGLLRRAELHERRDEERDALYYWGGFIQVAACTSDLPPALLDAVKHGRAYSAKRTQRLGETVDAALADDLAAATPRDRRRLAAATDAMLGRRAIYANHCDGMHYPFLPADEYFDRAHFPWLTDLEAATAIIRAELEAILGANDPGLAPYVQMAAGTPDNRWTGLDGSLDWSSLHLWREGVKIEEACARAPETARIVESLPLAGIPGRAPTVFFSILKAGKRIPPHTGVTNARSIVHLPLIVPGGCAFRVGGETRDWVEGEAFVFDDTIEHEAWNESDQDRAVLILDTWNPHLSEHERAMIAKLFAAADSAGLRRGG